ncbi:MAG TPA: polyprenyl synthetase family protein [Clostridiales bacterium]|nr:polyprenyl synthetase family protein [Clostridiales bacterium]
MKLDDIKTRIDEAVIEYLPIVDEDHSYIVDIMKYSLENGGKRIRPYLCLAFCAMCGGDPNKAIPFAVALEYIHTYSLIHDDLPCMDDDDMRRGKPSAHKKFGEANALLAGDALLTHAFGTITRSPLPPTIKIYAISALSAFAGVDGMIGGQYMDLLNETRDADLVKLLMTDNLKTGALIKAACTLGCYAADATPDEIEAAQEYAENLGIAFQIQDDILDVTATSEELGKPAQSDIKNEKSTYVSVLGLEDAKAAVYNYTIAAVDALSIWGERANDLIEFSNILIDRKN